LPTAAATWDSPHRYAVGGGGDDDDDSVTDTDDDDDDGSHDDEASVQDDAKETADATILADVPTSSDLGHLRQETFVHAGGGGTGIDIDCDDDGKGGKDRPISIDILEGEENRMRRRRTRLSTQQYQQQEGDEWTEKESKRADTDAENEDNGEDDDEEIKFVGATGKNPLSDFAHPRYDCIIKPFSREPTNFCPNCYCYVCDVKASECEQWKLSDDENKHDSHCYADRKVVRWKRRRSRLRAKRKRPERALKNIAIFLRDTVPTRLPSKRKTREIVRYGEPGHESNSDSRRALLRKRRATGGK
jgi:hypothetical protein